MKVLLTEEVEDLGMTGDVVDVADGYARNYLLPTRKAVEPTEANKKKYEKVRKKIKKKIEKRRDQAEDAATKLDGLIVDITRKAQEEGNLYGSVRKEDIISLVEEEVGIELGADQIDLKKPIEKTGDHKVDLRLYEDIRATLRVKVKPEDEEEE